MMKFLAYYLPAFHRIPENDEWWGAGFTEWDNTKKGKPFYKGHVQPMEPLNHHYYDLSNMSEIEWQVNLANKYDIYGFIFYHYWFNGKKLLEKPIEMFRDNKDLNLHYCLCWANEPWSRTWDGKNSEVLMPQSFGGVDDRENHFQYYLTFFLDERYIKINNSPMLYIYSCKNIPNINEMISYRNKRLHDYNLNDLYLVECITTQNSAVNCELSKAVTEFEPMYTCRFEINPFLKAYRFCMKKLKKTEYLSYDYVWKKIINKKRVYKERVNILGCYTQRDNTPRKGKAGFVHKGGNPLKFEYYLKQMLCSKRQGSSNEFCIINAWNEWGEGPVLEPSEQYGYGYLEGVKKIYDFLNSDDKERK